MAKIKVISDDVKEVILASTISGNKLHLNDNLPRELYNKVAKHIKLCGGRWDKKVQAHVFDGDAKSILLAVEQGFSVDKKQTLQKFYTPPDLARQLVLAANIGPKDKILEPSCGNGNLVAAVAAVYGSEYLKRTTCIDIDEDAIKEMITRLPVAPKVIISDFLEVKRPEIRTRQTQYQRIIMNPPFAGTTWAKHIKHALEFLAHDGKLVAICPIGNVPVESRLIGYSVTKQVLPADSFKSEGTNVATLLIEVTHAGPG